MPSCDGSNPCSDCACNCNCSSDEKTVETNKKKIAKLDARLSSIERQLATVLPVLQRLSVLIIDDDRHGGGKH